MKTYYYVSNPFSYSKCLNENKYYTYISGYNIFSNVRKLDFCFNLRNNFLELLNYKKLNKLVDNFISCSNDNDTYIFTANGYDVFSFILRDRLVQNGRRVVVEELDPERNILDKNGFVSMLRFFPISKLLLLVIKSFIKLLLINFLYKIKLYIVFSTDVTIGIPYNKLCISIIKVPFSFKPKEIIPLKNPTEILFVNPLESEFLMNINFKEYTQLILNFSKRKNIYLKLHPREINETIFINSKFINIQDKITDDVVKKIKIAMGFSSTLLIELALYEHIKVISLINILKWRLPKERIRARHFMDRESTKLNVNIYYPNSEVELYKLCGI